MVGAPVGGRFIYEKAHELGVRSVILDGPDSWAQSLLETKQIEKFVPVDFTDADSAFDRCVAALKKVKSVRGSTQRHGFVSLRHCCWWRAQRSASCSAAAAGTVLTCRQGSGRGALYRCPLVPLTRPKTRWRRAQLPLTAQ